LFSYSRKFFFCDSYRHFTGCVEHVRPGSEMFFDVLRGGGARATDVAVERGTGFPNFLVVCLNAEM
jgi:hypothetical protein